MGCSRSKLMETPTNPLQELQLNAAKREQRRRNEQKRQRQIAKMQKKQQNKTPKRLSSNNSIGRSSAGSSRHTKSNRSEYSGAGGGSTEGKIINQRAPNADLQQQQQQQMQQQQQQVEDYQTGVEKNTRLQLEHKLHNFLINQIMLATQFLGHFESEIASIHHELLAKENAYNQNLTEQSILFVNPLDVAVARRIKYKPVRHVIVPDKTYTAASSSSSSASTSASCPLQTQIMYVVFENIDIARPHDANYDSIAPLCKVLMETDYYRTTPCKQQYIETMRETKWKGYVRLKFREDAAPRSMRRSISAAKVCDEPLYTDGSSGYSSFSGYSSTTLATANRASTCNDGSNYDYIERLNSHRPMMELKMANQKERSSLLENKVLPELCVSRLSNFIEPWLEESDEDDDEEQEYDDDDDDIEEEQEQAEAHDSTLYSSNSNSSSSSSVQQLESSELRAAQELRMTQLQQNYLNSKEFMRYFADLLRQKLAAQLNIPLTELDAGTYCGCSIYTSSYEIIPAVHVAHSWPDCAFQFRIRERPISLHAQTGQQIQWPTRNMIKRIEACGFHVVPMGYAPKRKRNPFRELEWRIVFPKAERYLEQHLTSTQIKVFMLAKALIKTFVETHEKRKSLMFAIEHLRTHLFWECERDYCAWPEEFLGDVLLRFIRSFMLRLSKKHMPDYFIEERNLFENIPEESLIALYSIMADIAEYPLMHLMITLQNLEHATDFFPKLNYRKLLEHIVENDLLKLRKNAKKSRNLNALEQEKELLAETEQHETPQLPQRTMSLTEPKTKMQQTKQQLADVMMMMCAPPANGLLGMQQHQVRTNGKLRKRTQILRESIALQQREQAAAAARHIDGRRRHSVDSIEMDVIISKHARVMAQIQRPLNAGIENLRRTNLLEFFIEHLQCMLHKSIEMHNQQLSRLYLAQARRLCKYYSELGCDLNAKDYMHELDKTAAIFSLHSHGGGGGGGGITAEQQQQLTIIPHYETPPALPRRFSEEQAATATTAAILNSQNSKCQFNVEQKCADSPSFSQRSSSAAAAAAKQQQQQQQSSADMQKSLKIMENIMEVNDEAVAAATTTATPNVESVEIDAEKQQPTTSISVKLLNRISTVSTGDPRVFQKLTSRTGQMLSSLSTEEKYNELCELFKRQTLKLKDALNQTSES